MSTTRLSRRAFTAAAASALVTSSFAQTSRLTAEQRAARRNWRIKGPLAYQPVYPNYEYSRVDPSPRSWILTGTPSTNAMKFDYEVDGQRLPASQFAERTQTLGLLMLKQGKIVIEMYRAGTTPASALYSASMSKTVCSILMGIAVGDGAIRSVDQQIVDYVPELRRTAYDGVTIRQLIQMRSGVKWNDDFTVEGSAKQIQADALFDNVRRYTDAAFDMHRAHSPGERFEYNSVDSAIAGWIVERATRQPLTRFTTEKLWKPAGMESPAYWMLDGPPGVGREFVAGGFNAALRDYARLGQLMLEEGVANGRRILPASWVRDSVTSPSGAAQPGGLYRYGYLWWLLDGSEAYSAIGGLGQYIYVSPRHRTVIVKASWTTKPPERSPSAPPEMMPWDDETMAFFKAASEWTPG